MKKNRLLWLILSVSLLLTGCGWMEGRYVSVVRHEESRQENQKEVVMASRHYDLIMALVGFVSEGEETGVINLSDYPVETLHSGMEVAIRYVRETDPIGAYAVEDISYEVGTNNGLPAVAVSITYRRSVAEIQRIQEVQGLQGASESILDALLTFETGVVLKVKNYVDADFVQIVYDYAEKFPQHIMETPQVTVGVYGTGSVRVVELTFTYQTSRDSLRQMQKQVEPVFEAASLYVGGSSTERQKYAQLYSFLMERFDYKRETSITPAYSLLQHGVGDSRAFATVFAAMCRSAGLNCMTVTGTHAGEPRTWNIVLDNSHYYHVDLLRCHEAGRFREYTDVEMEGYVWDYDAYPKCPAVYVPAEEETEQMQTTPPAEETTLPSEETVPSEETLPPEETVDTEFVETLPDDMETVTEP